MISTVDLYMTADRDAVVGVDDPRARYLLLNAGREVHANELDLFTPGAGALAQAFLDEQSGGDAEAEDEVTTRRRGRPARQTSPADAGADDKSRKAAPEVKEAAPEPENLDDANLAELQAIATERGVSFEDDDDEDVLRMRLSERPSDPVVEDEAKK